MRWFVWLVVIAVAAVPPARADEADLGTALLLYASFDEAVAADRRGRPHALNEVQPPHREGQVRLRQGLPGKGVSRRQRQGHRRRGAGGGGRAAAQRADL